MTMDWYENFSNYSLEQLPTNRAGGDSCLQRSDAIVTRRSSPLPSTSTTGHEAWILQQFRSRRHVSDKGIDFLHNIGILGHTVWTAQSRPHVPIIDNTEIDLAILAFESPTNDGTIRSSECGKVVDGQLSVLGHQILEPLLLQHDRDGSAEVASHGFTHRLAARRREAVELVDCFPEVGPLVFGQLHGLDGSETVGDGCNEERYAEKICYFEELDVE